MNISPLAVCMPTYKRWDILSDREHPIHRIAREPYITKVFVLNQNKESLVPHFFLETVHLEQWISKLFVFHTPSNLIDNRIALMQSCSGNFRYVLSIDDDYSITCTSIRRCLNYLEGTDAGHIYAGFVPRFVALNNNQLIYHGNAASEKVAAPKSDLLERFSCRQMKDPYNMLLTGGSIVSPNLLVDDESLFIREYVSSIGSL